MSEREQILAVFEAHRKTPGAPYSEDHFLDYLLAQPKRKRAVYDSFFGLRRFNKFIDQVQISNSIFFSLKDRDANYSLDRFVARVIELRKSPRSSLVSFNNHAKAGFGWAVVALSNVPVGISALLLRHHGALLPLFLALLALLNIFWLTFFIGHKKYMARLHKQLLHAAAVRPNNSSKPNPLRGSA